ncbi:hypothetical protein MRX96_017482 [Rhipicephalus microplus]
MSLDIRKSIKELNSHLKQHEGHNSGANVASNSVKELQRGLRCPPHQFSEIVAVLHRDATLHETKKKAYVNTAMVEGIQSDGFLTRSERGPMASQSLFRTSPASPNQTRAQKLRSATSLLQKNSPPVFSLRFRRASKTPATQKKARLSVKAKKGSPNTDKGFFVEDGASLGADVHFVLLGDILGLISFRSAVPVTVSSTGLLTVSINEATRVDEDSSLKYCIVVSLFVLLCLYYAGFLTAYMLLSAQPQQRPMGRTVDPHYTQWVFSPSTSRQPASGNRHATTDVGGTTQESAEQPLKSVFPAL